MPTLTTIAASGTVLVNTEYSSLLITRNISHSSHMPLYRVRNFGYGWLYPRFVFITEHKLWVQKLKLLHSKINSTMFTLPWTSFFELINNGGDPNNTKLKEVKRGETKCRKDSTCRRSEYSSRRVRIVDYILFGNIENQIAETPSNPSAFTKCVRYFYNPIYPSSRSWNNCETNRSFLWPSWLWTCQLSCTPLLNDYKRSLMLAE